MHYTVSTTPIEPVHIEPNGYGGSEVWLRKDMTEFIEDGQTMHAAWEVNALIDSVPTADEIESDFESWFERIGEQSMSDAERLEKLEAQVLFTAIMTDTEV